MYYNYMHTCIRTMYRYITIELTKRDQATQILLAVSLKRDRPAGAR